MKYTILKNGNRITNGNADVCAQMEKNTQGVATAMMSLGMPNKCPIEKMRKCSDGSHKFTIAQHKSLLPLAAGKIDITIDGTHDTVNFFQFKFIKHKLQSSTLFHREKHACVRLLKSNVVDDNQNQKFCVNNFLR